MGNPWAPSDQSQAPGRQAPEQGPATPPGAGGWPEHAPAPGPHGPGPQAPGPHPVPPPDPAGVARAARTTMWSAAALLVGLLLSGASYPAMLLAPVTALTGFVLAILAVVRAARARARGPVIVLPVVLLLASLGWVVVSAQSLLYVDAARDYQQCRSAALTQQAERTCALQLEDDMEERLRSMLGSRGLPTPRP